MIIKKIISQAQHFLNYLYYFNSSIIKNSYPCKLIGNKIGNSEFGTYISYRMVGQQNIKEVPLNKLVSNKMLLERFHPMEVIKLGELAFMEVFLELSENERKEKFNKIKKIMLSSTHDVCPNISFEYSNQQFLPKNVNNESLSCSSEIELELKNFYPCKLVGSKSNLSKQDTILIFTILGKREGHEKSLKELISNPRLVEKFHPTEALKFGFIHFGDNHFAEL